MASANTPSPPQALPPRRAKNVVVLGALCAALAAVLFVFPDELATRAALVFAGAVMAARVAADEAPGWRASRHAWRRAVGDVAGSIVAAVSRFPRGVRFVLVVALVGASRVAVDVPVEMTAGLVVAGALSAPLLRAWGGGHGA